MRYLRGWWVGSLVSLLLGSVAVDAWSAEKATQWLEAWQDKGSEDGITAQCRQHQSKINQCKLRAEFDVSLTALTAVITDVDNFKNWAISVMRSERVYPPGVVVDESLEDIYVYTSYHFTGAYDRDAVSRYRFAQDAESKVVKITFKTIDMEMPNTDLRLVRFPLMAGYWQFSPLPNGRTQVELMSFTLPGGVVQKNLYFLYNTANLEASFDTIRALQGEVAKPKYRDASLSFVREPEPIHSMAVLKP